MSAYFDGYAQRYGEVLQKSLNATGENQEYFARRRVGITRDLLVKRHTTISRIVDFGCGLGTAVPHLVEDLKPESVVGVDVSREILKVAESRNRSARASFVHIDDFAGTADLVFCNGVFHHIELCKRAEALAFVRNVLEHEGYFAFWENNPFNPGTRYVMDRCEFDRAAVVIPPHQAHAMLEANGFEIIKATSAFFFPRSLAWMRGLEKSLASTMLGGQYLFLCRRGKMASGW
jgi:SAM-dependent methyltransferase